MSQFIEVTNARNGLKRLIKVDAIEGVVQSDSICKIIRVGNQYEIEVKESYEDVKKMLGIIVPLPEGIHQ